MELEDPRLEDLRIRLRPGCPLAYEEEVLVVCSSDGPANDVRRRQWAAYASQHRARRGSPHRRLFPIRSTAVIRDHTPHDVIPRYAAAYGRCDRPGMTTGHRPSWPVAKLRPMSRDGDSGAAGQNQRGGRCRAG